MAEGVIAPVASPAECWDGEADVVVVGFGGAGAAAALQAREAGASVIVLDRFAGGGATAFSGGVIYAGATPHQRQAGYEETADNMFRYLRIDARGCVSEDTLRRFCEGSAGDLAWLEGHGVGFSGDAVLGKTAYPPDDKFLYYSGNEKLEPYRSQAEPAPRGHRAVGTGFTGYAFFAALREAVERSGATIFRHMSGRKLLTDGAGRVIGIECVEIPEEHRAEHQALYDQVNPMVPFTSDAKEKAIADARALEERVGVIRRVRAKSGVILSTGGFVYNLDMLREHRPELAQNASVLMRLGSMGCDGSGIRMGAAAGGATDLLDSAFVARLIAPPNGLLSGVIVNKQGKRFVSEEIYCGFLGDAIARQPDAAAWIILDSRGFWRVVRECLNFDKALFKIYLLPTLMNIVMGGARRARTLDKLARKIGVDAAALAETVMFNNAVAAGRADDGMSKSAENRAPVERAPFYAIDLSTANKFGFTQLFTLGGLKVDEATGHVVRPDGTRIEGLFAAGRAAVGLCSIGYVSGMSIADAIFSGRRAANSASAPVAGLSKG